MWCSTTMSCVYCLMLMVLQYKLCSWKVNLQFSEILQPSLYFVTGVERFDRHVVWGTWWVVTGKEDGWLITLWRLLCLLSDFERCQYDSWVRRRRCRAIGSTADVIKGRLTRDWVVWPCSPCASPLFFFGQRTQHLSALCLGFTTAACFKIFPARLLSVHSSFNSL